MQANLVYHTDIGMTEGRSGLRFALETGQCLLVVRQFFRQKLQSNKTMQCRVLGLVNHTHPAAAEPLNDAVMRNGLADHLRECYGVRRCKSMSSEVATAASRALPWLASGLGCRG